MLISRIIFLLFASLLTLVLELTMISAVVQKLTGWDMMATSSEPLQSSSSTASLKPSNPPVPGLRTAARELSATLDKIVSGLQSQIGAYASYPVQSQLNSTHQANEVHLRGLVFLDFTENHRAGGISP